MRQTELNLSEEDRLTIEAIRSKGVHQAREVNRAHVLACLDRDIPESQTHGSAWNWPHGCVARPRRRIPARWAGSWQCSMCSAQDAHASTAPTPKPM